MRAASEWMKESLCRSTEPDNFFTGRGQNPTVARSLCPECPVRSECLDYGIMYDERGVWGGLTEKERKRLPSYIKTSLIREAKNQKLFENRPSVDEMVHAIRVQQTQAEKEFARSSTLSEELEPPVELPDLQSSPTVTPYLASTQFPYPEVEAFGIGLNNSLHKAAS